MLIIDAHLDLAWNALQWNRDLRRSAYTIRTQESSRQGRGRATGTVALPELRRGRVALCFSTVLSRSTGRPTEHLDYPSYTQCYGIGQGQLAYYRALERDGDIRIVANLTELNNHLAEWQAWDANHPSATADDPPP